MADLLLFVTRQARLCRAIVDVWDNEVTQGVIQGATKGKSLKTLEAREKTWGLQSPCWLSMPLFSCFSRPASSQGPPLRPHGATDEPSSPQALQRLKGLRPCPAAAPRSWPS